MKRSLSISFLLVALLVIAVPVTAIDPLPFADRAEEVRFQNLVRELRCLVCQNQNLADSDAGLAKDLRAEVFELIQTGKSDVEIKRFLTDRYGDFVLYQPPVKPGTWLLWFGPLLVLALGIWLARRQMRVSVPATEPAGDRQDGEFS
ncbi:MAG: cytochrome c-type biogenesis protein [Pseudomonadota bacterium]|nr:cytochrome c-type biogenesis protein [Pseudomonadota bacterium]